MPRDVACDHRRADARGFERGGLNVKRADDDTFFVFEHGRIDGAGYVVFGEFERRAHIDDFVEVRQVLEADAEVFQGRKKE